MKGLDAMADEFVATVRDMAKGTVNNMGIAAPGNVSGFKELADRIDGKAAQSVEMSSDPERPFVMQWKSDDA